MYMYNHPSIHVLRRNKKRKKKKSIKKETMIEKLMSLNI